MTTNLFEHLQSSLGAAYRLERELGGGGMSRVFLATETALDRRVVIKVLLPELAASVSVDRFRREIVMAARLQHPLIVPLLSAGEIDGLPYFTMPFISGESLRVKLARTGELPVSEAVRILRDVVAGLAYAHANGVMHRDVKPDNVLISGGVAVVTDFGVAKALSDSTHATLPGLTSRGMALGTPNYMAPEQASGDPQIDHRADIYAVGIMAYEMLAGHTPFAGRSTQAVLAAHIVEEPDPIDRLRPAIPAALAVLVMSCLRKRAADRPQSAAELLHVLDGLGTPTGGIEPTTITAADTSSGARGRMLMLGAVLVVLALAALVLLRPRPPATAPVASTVPPALTVPAPPSPSQPVLPAQDSPAVTAAPPVPATPSKPARRPRVSPDPPPEQPAAAATVEIPSPPADSSPALRPAPAPPLVAADSPAPAAVAPPVMPMPRPAPLPPPAAPPPAPVPPADPRVEIDAAVVAFARAVESRNVDNIRRVYPGVTLVQQRGWEQFFETVRDVRARLNVRQLQVDAGSADAQVTGTYEYRNNSTGRTEVQPVSFRATLRREPGGWQITQVR